MAVAGGVGVLAAALAIGLDRATAGVNPFVFAVVFLLAALAEAGVRLGRKAYIADGAPTDRRSFYTATANTATGALTLGFAVLGAVAQAIGVADILIVIAVLGALGVAAAWWMPEARDLTAPAA
jgi:MFS family permease